MNPQQTDIFKDLPAEEIKEPTIIEALAFDKWYALNKPKSHAMFEREEFVFKSEIDRINQYFDFVNQEFSVEMITEYFDGFYKSSEGFYRLDNDLVIWSINNYQIFKLNTCKVLANHPKTLNEFLMDCLRAGIKLIWSEKARKEIGYE